MRDEKNLTKKKKIKELKFLFYIFILIIFSKWGTEKKN